MRRPAHVLAPRILDKKSFIGEVTEHPRRDRIGKAEEASGFLARDAKTRHLFELAANAAHGRFP
jgi:hypothetical protein